MKWNLWVESKYNPQQAIIFGWARWRAPVSQRQTAGVRAGLRSGLPGQWVAMWTGCPSGGRRRDGEVAGRLPLQRASERRTGSGGKPSRQKPPRRPAVGSRPRVAPPVQPDQYGRTVFFFDFLLLFLSF